MSPYSFWRSEIEARGRKSSHVSTRLTREGWQFVFLILFVIFAAILQSINLLVLMAGALLAMLLIQWRLTRQTLSWIDVNRRLPSTIQARKPFVVELTIENTRTRLGSWLLIVRDRLSPIEIPRYQATQSHSVTLILDSLMPQQQKSLRYECTLPARGRYSFKAPELATQFPMSLMRGRLSLSMAQSILVHPTHGSLDHRWREILTLPTRGRLHRQAAAAGGDGEFYGLRDYRAGDPIRHVHWRTSAKRSGLVIRQFEREENQAVGILLDLWQTLNEPLKTEAIEIAIELAATIVTRVVATERSVASLAFIERESPHISRIQTANQLTVALDRLATVRPPKSDGLLEALRQTFRYTGGREPMVVLSTRSLDAFRQTRIKSPRDRRIQSGNRDDALDMAIEGRMIWLDVTSDRLDHFFKRGIGHDRDS